MLGAGGLMSVLRSEVCVRQIFGAGEIVVVRVM